ncbi:unnamed protein product [Owenia fusiformis]|uniref:snRNA-activating protein complex subunit 3 n=1 Tax=Owenia fusiformis TaxID=6347 RepID=A0A8J1XTE7_OWEFU|nr:unnamed protein product [Owenia fusiformis]
MYCSFLLCNMDPVQTSQVVNVGQFLTEFNEVITEDDLKHKAESEESIYISKEMNLSEEMRAELQSVCGLSTLECEAEKAYKATNEVDIMLSSVPKDTCLQTLKFQAQELQKRTSPSYYTSSVGAMKYKKLDVNLTLSDRMPPVSDNPEFVKTPEALLRVRVYQPYFPSSSRLALEHEYWVLGHQCLTELRDKIRCVADLTIEKLEEGDFSDNIDVSKEGEPTAQEVFPSGFFYIEGVFYNDMRKDDAKDYSKTIMDWAKDPSRGIGPFTSKKMEATTFYDLDLKIGQPYVYCHQGDCEHLIVFSDLRLVHPTDCQDVRMYPLTMTFTRKYRTQCRACTTSTAKWVVKESPLAPDDPCFFCDTCFRALHYDRNNKKVVQFKAYPFFDKVMI